MASPETAGAAQKPRLFTPPQVVLTSGLKSSRIHRIPPVRRSSAATCPLPALVAYTESPATIGCVTPENADNPRSCVQSGAMLGASETSHVPGIEEVPCADPRYCAQSPPPRGGAVGGGDGGPGGPGGAGGPGGGSGAPEPLPGVAG